MSKKTKTAEGIELTLLEKKFCEIYVSKDFYGNGVQSYIEAYNIDLERKGAYEVAKVSACGLLTKPNILAYINQMIDSAGLNDQHVDKQLLHIITQNAEFSSKVAAIREYNKLKARITEKIEHSVAKDQTFTIGGQTIKFG